MQPEQLALDAEPEPLNFPWARAVMLVATLWGSLWLAGMLGGRAGAYLYDDRYVVEAPYTADELATLERVSPDTFRVAELDMNSWESSVVLGRTIARLEGKVAGSLILLGVWGALGVGWLWKRQSARRSAQRFSRDFQ